MSWTDYHGKLHKTLRQRQLIPKQSRLLLAVSGGQDSLCLLKLFWDLQPKWGWDLAVAHCDHRWSIDAGMADHVEKVVARLGMRFFRITADTPVAETEASARSWRYQVLRDCCQANHYHYLVTGHTRTDRAETLFYNLIRGSGSDGLQALTWQRPLTETITLVRPLLNFSRAETQQFCEQFELPIWKDIANDNLNYARNRLRKQIFPQLKEYFNPQVETALSQTAEILETETAYLQQLATELYETAYHSQQSLYRNPLKTAPVALQRRVMRLFWRTYFNENHAPNFEQIEELTHLIPAPNRSQTSSFPQNIHAVVASDLIIFQSLS